MTQIINTYAGRVVWELDVFLNVLSGGQAGQSISERAADAQPAGNLPACLFCRFLSAVIEKNHCERTRAGLSITPRGGLHAAILLVGLSLLLTGGFWEAVICLASFL